MVISFEVDGFRIIYICITILLWVLSSIFSVEYFGLSARRRRYHVFSLLTLLSTIGVYISADLFTLFVFFELVSLLSYPLVAHDETPTALRAAETYLAVAIIGGMTTLMGLLLLRSLTGTLEIKSLYDACRAVGNKRMLYVSGALTLVGFGAKAGLFPLHIWLPKAHPAAPAPASALLSGILTKCGVFGVFLVSCEVFRGDANWGAALLVTGAVTMLLGAVLAVFSIDLKRTLACSSVSQIGFITVGIAMQCILGEHNALAVWGTILHMANHSVFKLVLFLSAGLVYMNLHSIDFNSIRGFGRRKPVFGIVFSVAAAGIAGVPFFSGYVSKTLLHESIIEGIHLFSAEQGFVQLLRAVEVLFIFTGGLTAAYMLKLAAVLFGKPGGASESAAQEPAHKRSAHKRSSYISKRGAVVLVLPAAAVLAFGLIPGIAEALAAFGEGFMHGHAPEHAVHYFAWENLKGAVYSLAIGAAIYILVIRTVMIKKDSAGGVVYIDRWPRFLDLENAVYRPLIKAFILAGVFFARVAETLPDALVSVVKKTLLRPMRPGRFPGRFYGRYYQLVRPEESDQPHTDTAVNAGFSVGLLLFGVGMCAALVYLLLIAFL